MGRNFKIKQLMRKTLTILLLLLSLSVGATNYYVSSAGSDAANGLTTGTAWATINKVNNTVTAGAHTVYFRRGDTWKEKLYPVAGVTYTAYGSGKKPIITARDVITGWSSSGNNLDTSQFVRTRNPDLNEEELRETIEEWMGSGYGSAGNNFLTDEEKQKIVQEAVNNWRPWWRSINPDTSQFVRTMTVDPDDELFATKRKWIQFADKDRKKYSPFF